MSECASSKITAYCVTNETKQTDDLKDEIEATVNRCLEAVTSSLPKLIVLGVNFQVIEVKELEFDIYF